MVAPHPEALRVVLSVVDQDIWILSSDRTTLWHNRGLSYTDWCRTFLRTKNLDLVKSYLDKCFDGSLPNANLEVEKEDEEGCRRWVRLTCRPVVEEGKVTAVVGLEKDVTTLRCALPRLMKMREEYHGAAHAG